ncbi:MULTISPECIES: flavodoxin family protein [Clostridia]|uniref:NAD(P)H-dependent oxidoreductase n=1 Tax=Lacrimispora xylanolytica TaxID=29375 RepID=A0ABY7A7J2_9FIRM|nr:MULTISPECIES: NAD(P)H-dependent oxidoreductase [Clostridia]WAJ22511.1 NAD(P)H-dependent oxidoreductase [Lacrimispora xylanolytica]
MKITVVTGTEQKGCTYRIKETFLGALGPGHDITEFYLPRDLPHFCSGCKVCFFKYEALCPHADYVVPIWNSMLDSELLVFASPVYALRTTAQMKALLDHLCVHWMVHRPDERMFHKRAAILTNAVGAIQKGAQRDIQTSLTWLGVSQIRTLGIGLMEGIIFNQLSEKRQKEILRKVVKFAEKFKNQAPPRQGLKVRGLFAICKMMHQQAARKETVLSADNEYWAKKGWIKTP